MPYRQYGVALAQFGPRDIENLIAETQGGVVLLGLSHWERLEIDCSS
jgi:hypothetical protein